MEKGSDLLDIINRIKKAGVGDIEKIISLEQVVKFGKPLNAEDEEYLIQLLYKLEHNHVQNNVKEKSPKLEITDAKKIVDSYKSHYAEKAKEKISESKFKLAGSKFCVRCTKKLSFKKFKPHKNWGIKEVLCKECFNEIKLKIVDFSVSLKEADVISSIDKKSGVLSIQNFDKTKRIVFGNKNFPELLSIPVEHVTSQEIIDYEEKSQTKKILTVGLKKTKTSPHLLIQYQLGNQTRELILTSKELAKISTSLGHLILEYQKETFSKKDYEQNRL